MKKFDLKVASAGTIESFVQAPAGKDSQLGGQALLQKLEADLEALESHLVELNTYNERLTSEYNEKVRSYCVVVIPKASPLFWFCSPGLLYVNGIFSKVGSILKYHMLHGYRTGHYNVQFCEEGKW